MYDDYLATLAADHDNNRIPSRRRKTGSSMSSSSSDKKNEKKATVVDPTLIASALKRAAAIDVDGLKDIVTKQHDLLHESDAKLRTAMNLYDKIDTNIHMLDARIRSVEAEIRKNQIVTSSGPVDMRTRPFKKSRIDFNLKYPFAAADDEKVLRKPKIGSLGAEILLPKKTDSKSKNNQDRYLRRSRRSKTHGMNDSYDNNDNNNNNNIINNKNRKRKGSANSSSSINQNSVSSSSQRKSFDLPVADSEPRYCTCQGPSYGDMVLCENPDCRYEWFHFACVDLDAKPRGTWYCDECKSRGVGTETSLFSMVMDKLDDAAGVGEELSRKRKAMGNPKSKGAPRGPRKKKRKKSRSKR